MSKFRRLLDRAGAELLNGVNAHNPDHEPIRTIGIAVDTAPRERLNDVETLGALTVGAGTAIALGSSAVELFMEGSQEVAQLGVGMGIGGVAIGAVIYGWGKISG